jgi:hypothetical protein
VIDHLQATYHDLKTVKTRNSVQVILEMPIEALTDVVALLGAPSSAESVWVVLARLREPVAAIASEPEPHQIAGPPSDDDHRPPLRMSASAAIISKEGAFATFMRDKHGYSSQEPDEALKLFCGIDSKRELDDAINSSARSNFIALRNEYRAWLNCEEPV